jgi:hypothetical protein
LGYQWEARDALLVRKYVAAKGVDAMQLGKVVNTAIVFILTSLFAFDIGIAQSNRGFDSPTPDARRKDESLNSAPAKSNAVAPDESPLFGGRDFDTWVHLLNVDLDKYTRSQAIRAIGVLGRYGREKDALSQLVPLMHSQDRGVAHASNYALAELGEQGVSHLVVALRDETYPYRDTIVEGLRNAGPRASSAVDSLIEIAEDSDPELSRLVIRALLAIGEPVDSIAGFFEKTIEQVKDPQSLTTFFVDLGNSPMQYEVKERLLIQFMDSNNVDVVRSSAMVLAMVGKNNNEVRGALRSAVRAYADDPIRRGAFPNVAAKNANVGLLLPILIEVAKEQDLTDNQKRDGSFMQSFARHVGQIGQRGRPAVPTLLKVLEARNRPWLGQVDMDIIRSLSKIGADARHAIPVLEAIKKELSAQELGAGDFNGKARRLRELQQIDEAMEGIRIATQHADDQK